MPSTAIANDEIRCSFLERAGGAGLILRFTHPGSS
jgi:hypothetical protein